MHSFEGARNINKMKCSRPHIVSIGLKLWRPGVGRGGRGQKKNLQRKENNEEGGVGGSAGCAVGVSS